MPLLDIDPLSGAVETMEYDHVGKGLVITRTVDDEHVLAANAESYNDSSQQWRGSDNSFWHVARIDMTVLFAWLREFNEKRGPGDKVQDPFNPHDEWERFLYGRLNSNEYTKLRTAPVRI